MEFIYSKLDHHNWPFSLLKKAFKCDDDDYQTLTNITRRQLEPFRPLGADMKLRSNTMALKRCATEVENFVECYFIVPRVPNKEWVSAALMGLGRYINNRHKKNVKQEGEYCSFKISMSDISQIFQQNQHLS